MRFPVRTAAAVFAIAVPLTAAAGLAIAASSVQLPAIEEVRRVDSALVACGTRHSLSSRTDPHRGLGCGRDVVWRFFEESARGIAGARVVVDEFTATAERTRNQPVPLDNLYLVVEGTDPVLRHMAFLVSGHFDSMCSDIMDSQCDAPGADDDASGTTVSIESARLLARMPHRATVVFAAVTGEEQGLLGGKRLLEWVRGNGYAVGGMLNNDIVGATNGSPEHRARLFCGEEDSAPARQLGLWIEENIGPDAVRLVFRKDRFGRGGDHLPFVEAGMPAVRFCEPLEDYRHQHQTPRVEQGVRYGDLPEFLDLDFLAHVCQWNARTLALLADAPAPPREVKVTGAVKPSATIAFSAEADSQRRGFELLARETTDPRWKVLKEVAEPGTYELARPIDNEAFAVRAVGSNGIKSIAVVATPGR